MRPSAPWIALLALCAACGADPRGEYAGELSVDASLERSGASHRASRSSPDATVAINPMGEPQLYLVAVELGCDVAARWDGASKALAVEAAQTCICEAAAQTLPVTVTGSAKVSGRTILLQLDGTGSDATSSAACSWRFAGERR